MPISAKAESSAATKNVGPDVDMAVILGNMAQQEKAAASERNIRGRTLTQMDIPVGLRGLLGAAAQVRNESIFKGLCKPYM